MEMQLEKVESSLVNERRNAQRILKYLILGMPLDPCSRCGEGQRPEIDAAGCFTEATSPEIQLHWIMTNVPMLRSVDGVQVLVLALRDASRTYVSKSCVLYQQNPSVPVSWTDDPEIPAAPTKVVVQQALQMSMRRSYRIC